MEYKDMWITNNRPDRVIDLKGVVIHWTANTNKGANAIANRNYFQNHPNIQASAHYIVDDNYIIRCIPENEVAWHAGGSSYTNLAKIKFNSKPNNYLIGIEMCVNSDGDWKKTYQNTVILVADILKRNNLSINDIYRHHDMTGKDCPRMMTRYEKGGEEYFLQFKNDVSNKLNNNENNKEEVNQDMSILNTKNSIKFNYNGTPKQIENYIISETSYIKTRDIIDLFSKILNYDENNRVVDIKDNIVKIDVDGKILSGQLIGDKTYCPIRDLAESLGKVVDYNEIEKKVFIK